MEKENQPGRELRGFLRPWVSNELGFSGQDLKLLGCPENSRRCDPTRWFNLRRKICGGRAPRTSPNRKNLMQNFY